MNTQIFNKFSIMSSNMNYFRDDFFDLGIGDIFSK